VGGKATKNIFTSSPLNKGRAWLFLWYQSQREGGVVGDIIQRRIYAKANTQIQKNL